MQVKGLKGVQVGDGRNAETGATRAKAPRETESSPTFVSTPPTSAKLLCSQSQDDEPGETGREGQHARGRCQVATHFVANAHPRFKKVKPEARSRISSGPP